MKLFSSVSRYTSLAYLFSITDDNSHVQPSRSMRLLLNIIHEFQYTYRNFTTQYCYKRIFDFEIDSFQNYFSLK